MLLRSLSSTTARSVSRMSTSPAPSQGPLYTTIQTKLTAALSPSRLDLIDESSHHAKHAAMRGVTQKETHFKCDSFYTTNDY